MSPPYFPYPKSYLMYFFGWVSGKSNFFVWTGAVLASLVVTETRTPEQHRRCSSSPINPCYLSQEMTSPNRWSGWNHRILKERTTHPSRCIRTICSLTIKNKSLMCIVALYLSSRTVGALQHINKTNKTNKTNTNYLHIQINFLQSRTSKHYTNIKIPLSTS